MRVGVGGPQVERDLQPITARKVRFKVNGTRSFVVSKVAIALMPTAFQKVLGGLPQFRESLRLIFAKGSLQLRVADPPIYRKHAIPMQLTHRTPPNANRTSLHSFAGSKACSSPVHLRSTKTELHRHVPARNI